MADAKELTSTEQWLESLDPRTTPARDGRYLRRVREAADAFETAKAALESAKAQLDEAVAQARIRGDSWGLIGMVLGVSRQAAQQRFAHIDELDRGQVTQRITAKDIEAGRIRLPATAKSMFPAARAVVDVVLKGRPFEVRWDPRNGPDRPRSGVLAFGRGRLQRFVDENEVLSIQQEADRVSLIELST
jgi:multidrug efflux pump subunit AcrA (membrane-fusion protein)